MTYAKTAKTQPEVWAASQALAKNKRKRAWDLTVSIPYRGRGLLAKK